VPVHGAALGGERSGDAVARWQRRVPGEVTAERGGDPPGDDADGVHGPVERAGAYNHSYAGSRAFDNVGNLVTALPMEAHRGRITPRYGGHLSSLRSTTMVFVALAVLLATVTGVLCLEDAPLALTAGGRWLRAVAALLTWVAGDAVALLACVAIVRKLRSSERR
jgi:hypothetical protein